MSWFDTSEGRGVAEALTEVAAREPDAVVAVVGRGLSGTVWLRGGEIAYAQTDLQPELRRALQLTGVADALTLAELARSATEEVASRTAVTDDVITVAEELTNAAVAQLLDIDRGSVQVRAHDRPPFGVLSSRPVADVLAAARTRDLRDRLDRIGEAGSWQVQEADGPVTLTADEWAVLCALARPTRADVITQETGRSYEQVRSVLGGLAERGLADRRVATAAPSVAIPARPARTAPPAPPAPPAVDRRSVASVPAPPTSVGAVAGAGARPTNGLQERGVGDVVRPGRAAALRKLIGAVRAG